MPPRLTAEEELEREAQLRRLRGLAWRSLARGAGIGAVAGAVAGYGMLHAAGHLSGAAAIAVGAAAGALLVPLLTGPTWYMAHRKLKAGPVPGRRPSAPRRPPGDSRQDGR